MANDATTQTDPVLERILTEFRAETSVPAVTLKPVRAEARPWSSKLGGLPYLPPGFAWPRSMQAYRGPKPMRLLAQLNFAELPALPGFPQAGVLQIYIDPDDLFGADFDEPTAQKGFRVVYHEEVLADADALRPPPDLEQAEADMMPFEGEFALWAERAEMPMSSNDFRFDRTFLEVYRRHRPTDVEQAWRLDEHDALDAFAGTGHHMGGFPFFTQMDPRQPDGPYAGHTVLLLQIDSGGDGADEILWGDCGVANFFIEPDRLARRDFSRVLYNWDCC